MIRKLAELKDECIKLDIQVKRTTVRESKIDYITALREHRVMRDFPQGVPFTELQPMLSYPYWSLKAPERERMWNDQNDWLIQEKVDGVRMIFHFVRGVGTFAHGRNLDSSTYRRSDLSKQLLFSDLIPSFSGVIDCECVMDNQINTEPFTSGGSVIKAHTLQAVAAVLALKPESATLLQTEQRAPLRFRVFDCPFWDNRDLRKKQLVERIPYLADFHKAVSQTPAGEYFEILPTQLHSKKVFFDRILVRGGEGAIFKRLSSTYRDDGRRDKNSWIKCKRAVELDAFVNGFEPGKERGRWKNRVATITFGIHTEEGVHTIAKVSSIPKRSRASITVRDPQTKEIKMHPSMLGKTAHLVGTEITSKSLRLLHPKVVRWNHMGVDAKDRCCYSMKDIRIGQLALPLIRRGEEGQAQKAN